MAKRQIPLSDLTAGELSPLMAGRFDAAIYGKGLAKAENFLAFPQGGMTMRPGTRYMGTTNGGATARLIPFIYSSTESYILELTASTIKIWKNGVLLPVYFTAPEAFTAATIFEVQYCQVENQIILVHRNMSPKVIVRTGDSTFQAATGSGGTVPDLAFNGPGLAVGASVASWVASTSYASGNIVLSAGNYYYCLQGGTSGSTAPTATSYTEASPFTDGTCTWRWLQESPFSGSTNYPGCVAHFQGRLWFASTTAKPAGMWASRPFDYGDFFYFDVVAYTGQQVKDPKFWYTYATSTAASPTLTSMGGVPTTYLTAGLQYYAQRSGGSQVYKVQSWNGTTVTFDRNVDTTDVASGSQMWIFTVWQDPSRAEYTTVTTRRDIVGAGCAIMLELGSDQCDAILWLATARALVVGTPTSEWIIPPDITAASPSASLQTRYGSGAGSRGFLLADAVVFVQGKSTLREYLYSFGQGAYQSPSLTLSASHILAAGVKSVDSTQDPYPTLWFALTDGTLAVLLYDKVSGVLAWSRFILGGGGLVESVATVPGSAADDVYAVVNRGGTRYLERFDPLFSTYLVDCGVNVGSAGATVTGLSRFTSVDIVDLTNGTVTLNQAVSAGNLSVPAGNQGHNLNIGKVFTGWLETLPLAAAPQAQGQLARPIDMVVRVNASYPFAAGPIGEEAVPLPSGGAAPFSGDMWAPLPVGWSTRAVFDLRQTGLPLTVIGIYTEVEGM
jgi:hypothetical protein